MASSRCWLPALLVALLALVSTSSGAKVTLCARRKKTVTMHDLNARDKENDDEDEVTNSFDGYDRGSGTTLIYPKSNSSEANETETEEEEEEPQSRMKEGGGRKL